MYTSPMNVFEALWVIDVIFMHHRVSHHRVSLLKLESPWEVRGKQKPKKLCNTNFLKRWWKLGLTHGCRHNAKPCKSLYFLFLKILYFFLYLHITLDRIHNKFKVLMLNYFNQLRGRFWDLIKCLVEFSSPLKLVFESLVS